MLVGAWLLTGCETSPPAENKAQGWVIGNLVDVEYSGMYAGSTGVLLKFDDEPNGIRLVSVRHGTIINGEPVTFRLNKVNKIYLNGFGHITKIEVVD